MSQENVELVRKAFESDLADAAAAYWHREIEYIEDPRFPGASSYKGRDAVLRVWRGYTEVLGDQDEIATTVERVFGAGERQVPFVRFRGLARAAGFRSITCGATWSKYGTNASPTCVPTTSPRKPSKPPGCRSRNGPGRIRTSDLRIMSPLL